MSRYIDADRIDWRLIIPTNPTTAEENMIYHARKLVEFQKTVDAVEVTRCRDCMHTEIDKYAPAECQNRCKLSHQYHEPNFFCKCGEPRMDLLEWIQKGDADEQGL